MRIDEYTSDTVPSACIYVQRKHVSRGARKRELTDSTAREYASGLVCVWSRGTRLCVAGAQERASSPPSGATLHLLLPLSASTSFFYLPARPTHMCMCTLVFSVRSEPAENARYCYIIIIVIVRGDSRPSPPCLADRVFARVSPRKQPDLPRKFDSPFAATSHFPGASEPAETRGETARSGEIAVHAPRDSRRISHARQPRCTSPLLPICAPGQRMTGQTAPSPRPLTASRARGGPPVWTRGKSLPPTQLASSASYFAALFRCAAWPTFTIHLFESSDFPSACLPSIV